MAWSYLVPTFLFLLFCTAHSLMASVRFKKSLFEKLLRLKPYYRLIYNLIALFLIGLWFISLPADRIIYRIDGLFYWLMILFQVFFFILALNALLSQNGLTFLGIRQLINKIRHNSGPNYLDEPERGELVTSGIYGRVRHPMYTFIMMVMIVSPVMTANLIYAIILFALYFWIGTLFEEKNLEKRFGEEYRRYRDAVPRFIPRIYSGED